MKRINECVALVIDLQCGNTDEQCDRHYQHKVSREEEMLSVMNHLPIAAAEGKRLC